MNAAKVVARLNPPAQRYEKGMGGFGAVTENDILLALSLITSDGARLLGRVLYAGHTQFRRELWLTMVLEAHIAAGRDNWRAPGAETGRVCDLALNEFMRPRRCGYCKGHEAVPDPMIPRLKTSCPKCAGHGSRPWGDSTRARVAKMGRKYWEKHWSERYGHTILPILDKYHDIFWYSLAKRLK